jgi:hypothetical protein
MGLITDDLIKQHKLTIYHQNIRSLYNNKEESVSVFLGMQYTPQFICLSEHHMRESETFQCQVTNLQLTIVAITI